MPSLLRHRSALSLLFAALAAACGGEEPEPAHQFGALTATAAPTDPGGGNVGFTVSSAATITRVAGYWTADRMANAKPADIVLSGAPALRAGAGRPGNDADTNGKAVGYPPAAGIDGWSGGTSGASGEATAAEVAPQAALLAVAVPRPYTSPPARLNGRVYFTKKTLGGGNAGDFACSGTSVNSPGLSLVWTAGHCVHGGPLYGAHANWIFVPAYGSGFVGDKPYGTWSAKELWTKAAWASYGDYSYDVGAAVVWKSNGLKLTQKIGGQGIWFNTSRYQTISAFGYPTAPPFNGTLQYRCNSPVLFTDDPGDGPDTSGILCDMTNGSSGGGWLYNLDANGWGRVNSVNSYKYASSPTIMYGPYHGDAALNLYEFVKNKSG